jgi:hypothetical protein
MAQGVCHGVTDDRESAAEPGPHEVDRTRRRDQQLSGNVRMLNRQPAVICVEAL